MKKNATMNYSDAVRPLTPNDVYENKGLIIKVGHRRGLDFHSCEDLVQEIAIKCCGDKQILFDPSRGELAGYLARIARNAAVDIWRKNRRNPVLIDDTELEKRVDADDSFIDDTTEREEQHALLERGIRELYRRFPSREGNDAFILFSRDGMRANEVARRLSVNERFVNVAVHRGTKRLAAIVRRLEREENEMRKAS